MEDIFNQQLNFFNFIEKYSHFHLFQCNFVSSY